VGRLADLTSGSSAAFARALDPGVRIDGGDVVLAGGERMALAATSRDELRRRLGVRRPRRAPITAGDIRAIALALPGATEREKVRRDGTVVHSFEVAKTMFVKLFEAGGLAPPDVDDVVMIRRVPDRDAEVASAPERFFVTPHYEEPSTALLTRLSENGRRDLAELRELIEESWARCAPKRLVRDR
jgi:hypothetical protein